MKTIQRVLAILAMTGVFASVIGCASETTTTPPASPSTAKPADAPKAP